MPVARNPFGPEAVAAVGAGQEDPWAMYYVVRKDRALTLGQAMSLAGGGAVSCADTWRDSARWGQAFAAWGEQNYRKIALRAEAAQFEWVRDELDCAAVDGPDGETVLCLPPRRKSERGPLLGSLKAYTEGPRPAVEPERPRGVVMRYVVRAAVMKSMGKAMAQAGHAALMCADTLGGAHPDAFAAWRANELAGEVLLGDDADWTHVQAQTDCVVVRDAGLTQVAAGTETVLALVPAREPAPAAASLQRVA